MSQIWNLFTSPTSKERRRQVNGFGLALEAASKHPRDEVFVELISSKIRHERR